MHITHGQTNGKEWSTLKRQRIHEWSLLNGSGKKIKEIKEEKIQNNINDKLMLTCMLTKLFFRHLDASSDWQTLSYVLKTVPLRRQTKINRMTLGFAQKAGIRSH